MPSDSARQNATARGIEPSAIGFRYIQDLGSTRITHVRG
jgi:hypothetical protein